MERSKLVAIITGAISLILAIAYLLLVQLLDLRGEMIPAPVSQLPQGVEVANIDVDSVETIHKSLRSVTHYVLPQQQVPICR